MQSKTLVLMAAAGVGLSVGGVAIWKAASPAQAADHLDPPARVDGNNADRAADIADVYAWHQGSGASAMMVAALTFAGPNVAMAGQKTPCDRDVLYTIHVSNGASQFDIRARFGMDDRMNCFVKVEGIPGAGAAPIVGPVERPVHKGGVKVFAGLRDDPFFFDLVGFRETVAMGAIRMTNDRDFFAGKNTSALVVEFPLAAVSPSGQALQVWGTTARIGGGV